VDMQDSFAIRPAIHCMRWLKRHLQQNDLASITRLYFIILLCGVAVARNNMHQVQVSDIDLTAEFHAAPVTHQIAETVP